MDNQSKQQKTWRENKLKVGSQETTAQYFNDTQPNHILISNPTSEYLYVGGAANVSMTTYDMTIPPYSQKLLCGMQNFTRIYVFNAGEEIANVILKSWEGDFNPQAIPQTMEMVGSGGNGLLGIVEVNNMLSPLPPGNNVIGSVLIESFSDPLPAGGNKIGIVDIDNMPIYAAGYQQVTSAAAGNVTVKASAGIVYKIQSAVPVTLYDNNIQAWLQTNDFDTKMGLECKNSIILNFSEPGTAFVLYR